MAAASNAARAPRSAEIVQRARPRVAMRGEIAPPELGIGHGSRGACKAAVGIVSQQPFFTPFGRGVATMGFKVAVVGATGNVGREILATLAERDFPADEVVALASSRSLGSRGVVRRGRRPQGPEPRHLRLPAASISCCPRPAPRCRRSSRRAPPKRARWSSTTPRSSAWTPTCRWSCPRSTRRRSPTTRSAASSPTRTARRSRWWWR